MAKTKAKVIDRPLDKISGNVKKTAWAAAIESLVILAFGILLVAWPDATINIIGNILGVIFIVSGIYKIISFFIARGQYDMFNDDLLIGTVALLIGIAIMIMGEGIANVFRIIIGIWIIYESLTRINAAIKLHAAGISAWCYELILALIMMVAGVFITFNTGAVVQLIGAMMIASGIMSIVGDFIFIHNVNTIVDAVKSIGK